MRRTVVAVMYDHDEALRVDPHRGSVELSLSPYHGTVFHVDMVLTDPDAMTDWGTSLAQRLLAGHPCPCIVQAGPLSEDAVTPAAVVMEPVYEHINTPDARLSESWRIHVSFLHFCGDQVFDLLAIDAATPLDLTLDLKDRVVEHRCRSVEDFFATLRLGRHKRDYATGIGILSVSVVCSSRTTLPPRLTSPSCLLLGSSRIVFLEIGAPLWAARMAPRKGPPVVDTTVVNALLRRRRTRKESPLDHLFRVILADITDLEILLLLNTASMHAYDTFALLSMGHRLLQRSGRRRGGEPRSRPHNAQKRDELLAECRMHLETQQAVLEDLNEWSRGIAEVDAQRETAEEQARAILSQLVTERRGHRDETERLHTVLIAVDQALVDAAQAVLFMRKEMTQAGPGTQKLQEAAMAIEEGITRAISLLGVRDGDDL